MRPRVADAPRVHRSLIFDESSKEPREPGPVESPLASSLNPPSASLTGPSFEASVNRTLPSVSETLSSFTTKGGFCSSSGGFFFGVERDARLSVPDASLVTVSPGDSSSMELTWASLSRTGEGARARRASGRSSRGFPALSRKDRLCTARFPRTVRLGFLDLYWTYESRVLRSMVPDATPSFRSSGR